MNHFITTGRLCNDPENHIKGDREFATFNLAVQRNFAKPGEQDSDFFRCICFNQNSVKFVLEYLRKGMKVEASGEIRTDTYEKDGEKIRTSSYVIDRIGFAESKESNEKYLNRSGDAAVPAE